MQRPTNTQHFRPCIDLHHGKVKQLVGATLALSSTAKGSPVTNFVSTLSPAHYASNYAAQGLCGGHIIMLGGATAANAKAAAAALHAAPNCFHLGGGLTAASAKHWLNHGARKLIFTSALFKNKLFIHERLQALSAAIGRERIVVDFSVRELAGVESTAFTDRYKVMLNGWRTTSELSLSQETLESIAPYASELLVHAVAAEGRMAGIDTTLIRQLAAMGTAVKPPLAIVYAGGIHTLNDIQTIHRLGQGTLDFTVGSALELYGGTLSLAEVQKQGQTPPPAKPSTTP